MAEGKPYRYGLIAAGMCVLCVGLFIMTQEKPHVYMTMSALGVTMVTVGTAWSMCQCYPKVTVAPESQESLKDGEEAVTQDQRYTSTTTQADTEQNTTTS
ncbi:barttin isoform X2 [Cheilinus undulatus]|uniref:barttin isoform X2 n=1 Tax=Cheilinus undulatus TaxID=241271 RepID=UPI001BD433FA|nr:barttin isoform X2 [Cheilinus undulatus]